MWDSVDMDNKYYMQEYLSSLTTVSDATHKRYEIDVRQFLYWVYVALNDKPLYELTNRDFQRYLDTLKTNGASVSSIQSKRNCLITFLTFLETHIKKEDERFKDYVSNFSEVKVNMAIMHDIKHPVTFDEFRLMRDELERQDYKLAVAWLVFVFYTGAYALDFRQIRTEIVKYPFPADADYVLSHSIARTRRGSLEKYCINYKIRREVYDAMKAFVDSRGYDYDYIFSAIQKGSPKVVSTDWAGHLCKFKLSEIIGRAITPQDFRDAYKYYIKEENRHRQDWNEEIMINLLEMEYLTDPMDLSDYEDEIKEILNI